MSAAFLASSFERMAIDFHNAILGRLCRMVQMSGAIEACRALLESLLEAFHACQVRPGGVAVSLNAVQAAANLCDELRLAAVSFGYPAIQSGGTTS